MIIGTVIISSLLFYSTYHMVSNFQDLTKTSEKQIEMRKAARELMDASDYLTERVQRFTVNGDKRFLKEYFDEALDSNHREDAIDKMSKGTDNEAALKRLKGAMKESVELMKREYYAMKLVIEAKNIKDYPEILESVKLSDKDKALSSGEKMASALETVENDKYYEQKDRIRKNMRASLYELEEMAYKSNSSALDSLDGEMNLLRGIIVIQIIVVFLMVWITTRFGVHPILDAEKRIREDGPVEEKGAKEFRILARAYNKMYEFYKRSLDNLNFKASHDELTGAYNRAGYELLLSGIELKSTYMMLFDVDNFKSINDNYGHDVGDKVLKKLVKVLKHNFRSEDYVCRLGGDEFVVLMVHSADIQQELIAEKIDNINREMAEGGEGMPPTSISVGIVNGADVTDTENLFEKTDEAMYQSKRSGKSTYTFYND